MQSKPEVDVELRVFLLVIILLLAGASLPIQQIQQAANLPYNNGTWLFINLLIDLLQRKNSIQMFNQHPTEVGNLLTYFSDPKNFNESYWWLEHRTQLIELFQDEKTFILLAHNPWLFTPLHSLIDYSPAEFEKAISNRTFFNDLLQLGADYPELRTILSSSPILMVVVIEDHTLLPYVRSILKHSDIKRIIIENPQLFPLFLSNPTLKLPSTSEWALILQPANNTIIKKPTSVLVLIHSFTPLNQTILSLVQNSTVRKTLTGALRNLNSTNTYLYNATVNPTNTTLNMYYLQANITRYYAGNLTAQIVVYLTSGTSELLVKPLQDLTATSYLTSISSSLQDSDFPGYSRHSLYLH